MICNNLHCKTLDLYKNSKPQPTIPIQIITVTKPTIYYHLQNPKNNSFKSKILHPVILANLVVFCALNLILLFKLLTKCRLKKIAKNSVFEVRSREGISTSRMHIISDDEYFVDVYIK